MKKMKLVMVGNGMAGVRTIEELLKISPELYDITVFGAEPHPNYNRILLSPVLAGEQTLDEIVLNSWEWYEQNGIRLHAGKKVVEIDRVRRVVRADDGTEEPYDRLLLCTGSNPFILPVPGKELGGVIAYRDIADTNAMIEAAAKYRKAVVIGGGLLGLEAANGLMKRGMDVTVVHVMPWLMERQLDDVAGKLLQKSLEERGLKFMIGAHTQELVGGDDGRVKSVKFKDGTVVEADLVVMAVTRPLSSPTSSWVCAPIMNFRPRSSSDFCSSLPATSSSWRSISQGMTCTTVTSMPRSIRPLAASRPSRPPPITTARLYFCEASIIALVSAMSR